MLTFPVEVPKALAQSRVQVLLITLDKGVFTLFPEGKKCGVMSALEVGTECGL